MNIFIHGIYTSDSSKSIGKLKKYMTNTQSFDYGNIGILGALFKNRYIAKDLSEFIKREKVKTTIIAHSNGNAITVIAAEKYGAEIENLVCLGAALNRNIVFPKSIKNILVISTKKDMVTKFARFFDSIPLIGFLVPDIWGSMGTDNYVGNDKRVTKVFLGNIIVDHSDYFSNENSPKISRIIDDWLDDIEQKRLNVLTYK